MLDVVCLGITLLILLGLGLLFHILLKITPEESWATGIMTVMAVIFLIGLTGSTIAALYIIYAMGIAGIFAGLAAVVKKKEYSLISFLSPSIIMMIVVMGVGIVAFHGMHICNWDELFQWGKAANYMVLNDTLLNGKDFTGGSDLLLSTTTIFHYFFARIGAWKIGSITESDYYVSNLVLWFSAVILPLSGLSWKKWKRVGAFGLFQFLFAAIVFVQPYYNIYTDQPTAYWAGGLIAWLLLKKNSNKTNYLIPLILINVAMMKSMVGPLFAGLVILAIIINYYSECKINNRSFLALDWKKQVFSVQGVWGLLTIVSPVLFTVIWSFVVKANGVYRGISVFSGVEQNRFKLTIKAMIAKMFKALNGQDESLYLSYICVFVLVIIVVFVLYPLIMESELGTRFRNLFVVYIIGFGGYFLVMLYAYLKVFGYTDSVRAMSLERYLSDYVMLGIIPLMIPIFLMLKKRETKAEVLLKRFVVIASIGCIIYGSSGYILPRFMHMYAVDQKNYKERERFLSYAKQVREYTNEEGKIYFINQSTTGLFVLVADYELGNQISREGMCFNFRKNTKEAVLGLTEYPIETLPQVLEEEGYDYLWVYTTNDYFNEKIKKIFGVDDVKNGKLYKVRNIENKIVLEYIATIK